MDEKKRIKTALKLLGKSHVNLLREAFGDRLTISWMSWEKQQLDNKTPLQVIESGDVVRVKKMVDWLYDLSTLPPDTEEETDEAEELVEDAEED
jgi:hypothetical protein